MNKIAIITGGSKGIGNALALEYKYKGYSVFSIARTKTTNLEDKEQFICDLSNPEETELVFKKVLIFVQKLNPSKIVLINNAGTLGQINRIENIDYGNIMSSVNLNLIAPLVLSSLFIGETKNWDCTQKIINISSGAAVNTYYGWSVYCATKSAVDSFTKVIAVEQEMEETPVKIIAIYPGVVDTNMQTEIRTKSKEEFSNIKRFIELKENDELSNPKETAEKIYKIDQDISIENGAILDIRDF